MKFWMKLESILMVSENNYTKQTRLKTNLLKRQKIIHPYFLKSGFLKFISLTKFIYFILFKIEYAFATKIARDALEDEEDTENDKIKSVSIILNKSNFSQLF